MPVRTFKLQLDNQIGLPLVHMADHLCHGEWTEGWGPPPRIEPNTSGSWLSESHGIAVGTEGWVKYMVETEELDRNGNKKLGETVYVYWDNPYTLGSTLAKALTSPGDIYPDCDYDKPADGSAYSAASSAYVFKQGLGGSSAPTLTDFAFALVVGGGPFLPVAGLWAVFTNTGILPHPECQLTLVPQTVEQPIFQPTTASDFRFAPAAGQPLGAWAGTWVPRSGTADDRVTVTITATGVDLTVDVKEPKQRVSIHETGVTPVPLVTGKYHADVWQTSVTMASAEQARGVSSASYRTLVSAYPAHLKVATNRVAVQPGMVAPVSGAMPSHPAPSSSQPTGVEGARAMIPAKSPETNRYAMKLGSDTVLLTGDVWLQLYAVSDQSGNQAPGLNIRYVRTGLEGSVLDDVMLAGYVPPPR